MTKFKKAKQIAISIFEKRYIKRALLINDWNISHTADYIGIDRKSVHRMINKYKIKKPKGL